MTILQHLVGALPSTNSQPYTRNIVPGGFDGLIVALGSIAVLTGFAPVTPDPRGLDRDETLLSVSATGEADTRPDRAQIQAGINTWARTAKEANAANLSKIDEIAAALKKLGIEEKDIQTRAVSVQRIEYCDRKGQYQASNIVSVVSRDVSRAGPVVMTVTDAGANLVSGPELRIGDLEAATNAEYASAYKASRERAEAYAKAADMEVSRVRTIRNAGGMQGERYLPGAIPVTPSPVMAEQASAGHASSARIMPG